MKSDLFRNFSLRSTFNLKTLLTTTAFAVFLSACSVNPPSTNKIADDSAILEANKLDIPSSLTTVAGSEAATSMNTFKISTKGYSLRDPATISLILPSGLISQINGKTTTQFVTSDSRSLLIPITILAKRRTDSGKYDIMFTIQSQSGPNVTKNIEINVIDTDAPDPNGQKYDLILNNAGASKIEVIKVIREITGLGLQEAKNLVDKAPILVKSGLTEQEAQVAKAKLEAVGATVELKPVGKTPPPIEKKFDVVLVNAGANKIEVIKVIREITGLGLKEAKDLVDNGGIVKNAVLESEAVAIKNRLEAAGATVELKPPTVQEKFDLILANAGANKIAVIKAVREITGLGLKEAKDLVDNAPSLVKSGLTKAEAEDAKKKLVEAGAIVEVKKV